MAGNWDDYARSIGACNTLRSGKATQERGMHMQAEDAAGVQRMPPLGSISLLHSLPVTAACLAQCRGSVS